MYKISENKTENERRSGKELTCDTLLVDVVAAHDQLQKPPSQIKLLWDDQLSNDGP